MTRIGYIAVGMEQFPATDEEQLEYIRPIIEESDYYIVIIRGKYGSLANDGISFTEKECDYALEKNKPVLAFLFKNPGQLRVDETDADPEKARKLDAFKKKLEERRIVKYWEDSSQLVNDIKDSIREIERRRPGVGWIRGDQALDPKIYKELEDVRRQNKEIREKLDNVGKEDIVFPSHLSQGSDLFEIEYTVSELSTVKKVVDSGIYNIPWDMLFAKLAGRILREVDEWDILSRIETEIQYEKNIDKNFGVNVEFRYVKQARYQLEALGLIKSILKQIGIDDPDIVWTLTDKGRRYISHLNALRRPAAS